MPLDDKFRRMKNRMNGEGKSFSDQRDNAQARDPNIPPQNLSKYLTVPIFWLHSNLPKTSLLLLAAINQLDIPSQNCTASNDYLGKMIGLKTRAVVKHLEILKSAGLIIVMNEQSKYRRIAINHDNSLENKVLQVRDAKDQGGSQVSENTTGKILRTDVLSKNQANLQVSENTTGKILRTDVRSIPLFDIYYTSYNTYQSAPEWGAQLSSLEKRNEKTIELHPIIEFWNSLHSKTNSRQNIVRHTNPKTKTYKSIIRRINQLQSGEYAHSNESLRAFSKAHRIPISLVKKKWEQDEIKEVLREIANLNWNSPIDLSKALFNPHHPSGLTSLFLKVASEEDIRDLQILEDPNPEVTEDLKKCLTDSSPKNSTLQRLYRVVIDIMEWCEWADEYCREKGKVDKDYRDFRSYLSNFEPELITKEYLQWNEENRDLEEITVSVNALGPRHHSWKKFLDSLRGSFFGVEIELDWPG
jgi:DNA-binding transcriptional ArsR family regulator